MLVVLVTFLKRHKEGTCTHRRVVGSVVYSVGIFLSHLSTRFPQISCIKLLKEGGFFYMNLGVVFDFVGDSNYDMNIASIRFHIYIVMFKTEASFYIFIASDF